MKLSEALEGLGLPIAYYPGLARLLGGVKACVLFCQLFYWSERTGQKWGEVWKSLKELVKETGMTMAEVRAARDVLADRGVLVSRYARLEHQLYFTINRERLDALWLKHNNGHLRNSQVPPWELADGDAAEPDLVHDPETTSETTNRARGKNKSDEERYDSEFLSLYPGPHRDDQRAMALAELRKLGPDRRAEIIASLKVWRISLKFTRDDGEYAPGPGKFLKEFFGRMPAATNGTARAELRRGDQLYGERT
jgi:hypothetical protein